MKLFKLFALCALLALLLVPAAVYAQEQAAPEHGVIEFGGRGVTGEVYGRNFSASTTVPGSVIRPDLLNSSLNAYTDNRNGFYIPKSYFSVENLFGSQSYFHFQSASNSFATDGRTLGRDQTVLVTLGQYGKYKAQFRFDEIPHIFSGTTSTLFSKGGTGVWSVNPALQSAMFSALCGTLKADRSCSAVPASSNVPATLAYNSLVANTLNGAVTGGLVPGVAGVQPFTQQETRKAFTGLFSWNLNPDVNVSALVTREHQLGTRPIGFVMGNSSTGYIAEAPEAIDYYTNTVRVFTDFGGKHWDGMLGYQGSFFQNNIPSMVVGNPFSNVYNQVTSSMSSTVGPATGRMDLYPDNNYQQFVGQGAAEISKRIHVMASVTPGWMSQTASFQPLTTNTFLSQTPPAGYPSFLPAPNLNGQVQTLAMNYTAVFKAKKNLVFNAKYQHYDYNNNTPDLLIRPTVADTSYLISSSFHGSTAGCYDPVVGPSSENVVNAAYTYYCPGEQTSFNTKLFDVGGTWNFTKKNSVKFGYQRGWMDRTGREVAESIEDSFYGALDLHLRKDLLLRVSGRHQNRMPQGGVDAYELDPSNVYARMPDQGTRVRNRGDAQLQWDATQKLSLYAFFGTLQDNYNQRNSVNSETPLGNATGTALLLAGASPTPIYGPYYAYGLLTSVGRNYGAGANYALTPKVVLFAEYAREKNTGIIIQGRGGNAPSGAASCLVAGQSCDPINDLLTAPKDVVNSYYGGTDITVSKKLDFSVYYSLSLAQSFVNSDGVNCQIGNGWTTGSSYCATHFANWKMDTAANPAVSFGYPQNVNRIHEVGAIARFKLTENLVPKFEYIFRQFANNDWQTGVMNPYSFVGTSVDPTAATALHKMLFLGADNPSYRAHIFSATLEYHF
jgi:hypothetical protein